MSYTCGTCGSRTLIIRGVYTESGLVHGPGPFTAFEISCGGGHRLVPVPSQELVITFPEEPNRLDDAGWNYAQGDGTL